jgi:hypothetical protein
MMMILLHPCPAKQGGNAAFATMAQGAIDSACPGSFSQTAFGFSNWAARLSGSAHNWIAIRRPRRKKPIPARSWPIIVATDQTVVGCGQIKKKMNGVGSDLVPFV